ncbi:MAG: M42 family metallopeptidase [Clostridia bacterium]|nr:M42 family metallopeptidase [Clostridia bacterium]
MNIDVKSYKQFYFDTAIKIFNTPSPTGYYTEIESVLKQYADDLGVKFERTNKGCFIFTVQGEDQSALGLAAHADTLGAMVRSISPSGIKFTKIGGPILSTFDGEYCTVITRKGKKYSGTFLSTSPSKHVYTDGDTLLHTEENMYVRLDENIKTPADVDKLGIRAGDYIALDPKTTVTSSGYLKSRFIDDKASVVAFITVLKIIKDYNIKLKNTVKMLVTMYEEVGHGASFIPENIVKMLCVDMGCIGKDLTCTEHTVSICAKDSHGPYDYDFTNQLIKLAEDNNLDFAVDVYPYYGSDVGAMWSAGYDIPGALIGTGVHASHGMERTHFDGIENTIKLILLYLGV